MSTTIEIKKTCDETEVVDGDVRDVISTEYHQRFTDLLLDFLKRIDHLIRQRGNLNKVDSTNLVITRTTILFINQVMAFVFDQRDLLISEARPDLVPYIDRLSDSIKSAREGGPVENGEVSLTLMSLVMHDAELFIANYYNPPKRSRIRLAINRVMQQLMLRLRGVKG